TFGIVGLAHKVLTDYVDDGFGLNLARDLLQRGYKVIAHEPGVGVAPRHLPSGAEYVDDLERMAGACDVCVLTYLSGELKSRLEVAANSRARLIDVWQLH